MAREATLTLVGLYNYDQSLFDNMWFPDDWDEEAKQTVVYNILAEAANLEVVYPNFDIMKTLIGVWSYKESITWMKLLNAMNAEYDPIENYHRTEERTDTISGSDTHSGDDKTTESGTDTDTESGTDTVADSGTDSTSTSGTDTTTNYVTSYDSNSFQAHDKSDLLHGAGESITYGKSEGTTYGHKHTLGYGHINTLTHGEKITKDYTNGSSVEAYGNIGVTTSQQMLEQEIELAPKLNLVNYITESFINRFCLLVY